MTNYELLGSIRRALTTIADHYDMALIPATRPAMKLPTTPSPESKIHYAPKGMKEAPAPVSLDALDTRRDTSRDLRYWVGFIYDEIRDHNDEPIRTLVDGDNVRSMCEHIARWADHVVTQFPDDAHNLDQEIRGHARKLRSLAYPDRRSTLTLGSCPLDVDSTEGPVTCGGEVRTIDTEDSTPTEARCQKCGTEAVTAWWEKAIMPEVSHLITGAQVPGFIKDQFGRTIQSATVRKWIERGVIESAGADPQGRTLYDKGSIAYAIARRELRHA